ncbi:MAG TPA: hypothetical protein VFD36_29560 [Kofleriaceae bacterium]|nr:hypothetical protein [Kofleriaceae bacterium]
MLRQEHAGKTWWTCGECYLAGIVPWNDGPLDKPAPPPADTKPGMLAGKSLLTGERYFYTDEQVNLRTGERTKAT